MKILYFHQHFSTPAGSTGTRSYENCMRLLTRGHAVTMVCGSYNTGVTGLTGDYRRGMRRGVVNGIDVIEFQLPYANRYGLLRRSLVFLRFAVRSVWIALTERYDLIFATSTPLTAAIPGIAAKLLRRKKFVFEVRDLWPELPEAMGVITSKPVLFVLGLLEKWAYSSADGCIGLSPGIVSGIKRHTGASKPVVMIPNGCDLDTFGASSEKSDKTDMGRGSCVTATFTGAHGIANGLDAVLDMALELKKRGRSDIRIVLVGDGARKSSLVARARNDGIENLEFHDPMPKTELKVFMETVDIGLMTLANVPAFYFGTSPNKFFDYIAQGLPVVNNYPGWLAEMIDGAQLGLAVEPDDPSRFADALEYLADNPKERKMMGKNARRFAERNFDRQSLSSSWVDEIERIASQ